MLSTGQFKDIEDAAKIQEVQIQYIVCSSSILLFFLLIFHHAQYRLI